MNSLTISILGCGWLGLPLAEHLLQKGYPIKGSTASTTDIEKLKDRNIIPYHLEITDQSIFCDDLAGFLSCDILIVCFPPSRREDIEHYYPAQIQQLVSVLKTSSVQHILFISSTSVYRDVNREVTEAETQLAKKGSGKALHLSEYLLQNQFSTTCLRFGGLIGYDRMPHHYLHKKKLVTDAHTPLNLIHRDDCIQLVEKIIDKNVWREVLNACADTHPTRKEFYMTEATVYGLSLPEFSDETATGYKIVRSDKIKQRLDYTFTYPDILAISAIEKSINKY
ncbi:NAD-dependent epimerase/dehydratase family protein [Cytophagaceae bacterium DM2B3-1]|uniref:NAD-dependent epimerase/dehydratase family protein n=1 Tax=Xanthocytophaga flava TaxID=3048013 RepID=A0ABT7CWD4_9BACT|nr:NAD-dependent epimerase/dehydratase family protein [Xanthocytophaga flavus]MDJ1498038.1 NAD-dependent epimerase/dehydratase family protein [Xanthocytophaga flavus]